MKREKAWWVVGLDGHGFYLFFILYFIYLFIIFFYLGVLTVMVVKVMVVVTFSRASQGTHMLPLEEVEAGRTGFISCGKIPFTRCLSMYRNTNKLPWTDPLVISRRIMWH